MKQILYIGKYNGIIGGIERYMQNSADLLQKNGFACCGIVMQDGGERLAFEKKLS